MYRNLATRWVDYMRYLNGDYPYLFPLAMRTNPFDQNASVIAGAMSPVLFFSHFSGSRKD